MGRSMTTSLVVLLVVLGLAAHAHAGAVELTNGNFAAEVKDSGKNAFIKFLAPWWGHCKSMKPAWDQLGDDYKDSSSVLIGDVDCTVEKDLCQEYGVSGYPTIKYFTADTEESGAPYQGGRDFASLKQHVEDKLSGPACMIDDTSACSEKEVKYINKMKTAGDEKIAKQIVRLTNMKGNKMKKDLKQWLFARLNILQQFAE